MATIDLTLVPAKIRRWRRPMAGSLIFMMILFAVLAGFGQYHSINNLLSISGLCGWIAAILLFTDAPKILQIQVGIILSIATALGIYAISLGGQVNTDSIISANANLLAMVVSVGFLKLVALPSSASSERLPTGAKAYVQTLLGLNLSSSVINISAPILIADRIHEARPLQRFSSQSITRVFCGAANWSPFFAAMAVVLTYVSDATLSVIIMMGIPFTLFGLLIVLLEAKFRYASEVESFVGFPMHLRSLSIPLLLVITVVSANRLLPSVPILSIIALSSVLITLSVLAYRNSLSLMLQNLKQHIIEGLPRSINELALFLAAGVIAAGVTAVIQQGVITHPFDTFDATTAAKLLGVMLLLGAIGIHPVIAISSFTALILPLDPNHNLLAFTYLLAWNLGTCASPLSGTHLIFQGRYGIPSWKAAMWNWPYVLVMYGIAVVWLQVVETHLH